MADWTVTYQADLNLIETLIGQFTQSGVNTALLTSLNVWACPRGEEETEASWFQLQKGDRTANVGEFYFTPIYYVVGQIGDPIPVGVYSVKFNTFLRPPGLWCPDDGTYFTLVVLRTVSAHGAKTIRIIKKQAHKWCRVRE